jgi:hypothetical protein
MLHRAEWEAKKHELYADKDLEAVTACCNKYDSVLMDTLRKTMIYQVCELRHHSGAPVRQEIFLTTCFLCSALSWVVFIKIKFINLRQQQLNL